MLTISIENRWFRYEHLFARSGTLKEIKSFTVAKETGKGLEYYIRDIASEEEQKHINRTYIVRDKFSDEIAGYFSLRAGLFTIEDDDTGSDINFYSVPAIELSNFAVNSAYREKHPEFAKIGAEIFRNFVIPTAVSAAQLIGVQALYIYALPEDELISYYGKLGFRRLPPEMEKFTHEHTKPAYDEDCIFMYQVL